jgi:hypothetical protein
VTAVAIVAAVGFLLLYGHATVTGTVVGFASPTTTSPATAPGAVPPTTGTPVAVTTTTGAPAPVATTTAPTTPASPLPPHFDTPPAAMTYLAAAWNSHDIVDLDHVTNPAARAQLVAMHSEAVNLRLDHCTGRPQGDYLCYFNHDYPASTATTLPGGQGQMVVLVGPARTPGWYMTVFVSCG